MHARALSSKYTPLRLFATLPSGDNKSPKNLCRKNFSTQKFPDLRYSPLSPLCSYLHARFWNVYSWQNHWFFLTVYICLPVWISQWKIYSPAALIVFLHLVHSDISNKLQTHVIYLDFQKTFESVPQDKLLIKLWSMGITGNPWCWFQAYIPKFQTPTILHKWTCSNTLPIIKNIPTLVKTARLLLLADDIKLSVWNLLTISILYIPKAPPISCSTKKNRLSQISVWSLSYFCWLLPRQPGTTSYTECHCDLGIIIYLQWPFLVNPIWVWFGSFESSIND